MSAGIFYASDAPPAADILCSLLQKGCALHKVKETCRHLGHQLHQDKARLGCEATLGCSKFGDIDWIAMENRSGVEQSYVRPGEEGHDSRQDLYQMMMAMCTLQAHPAG